MIDVHILAHPQFPTDRMVNDMHHPKINMHVMPHVEGNLLLARRNGFAVGSAPYVSWVDPDDAVLDLSWIDAALEILEDKNVAAVYPRWTATSNGSVRFTVPQHKWSSKTCHIRCLPYAHHLTIMRREYVDDFFVKAYEKISTAVCNVDTLCVQSMQLHGVLQSVPTIAYEWKLRNGSSRNRKNKGDSAIWAESLYLQLLFR